MNEKKCEHEKNTNAEEEINKTGRKTLGSCLV